MARKMGYVKPTKKGQKGIKFKQGALTQQAHAAGYKTAKAYCASNPKSGLARKRCAFMKNVLVGRK